MAKPATALTIAPLPDEQQQAPTPPAPKKVFTFDVMTFEEADLAALPAETQRNASPWRAKFDEVSALVLAEGKPKGFYVPAEWYVQEKNVAADKATHGYIKNKLGDDWKKWLEKDASRAKTFKVFKSNRMGTENGYTEAGPGVLVIIKKITS
jgi:hypothetical protein